MSSSTNNKSKATNMPSPPTREKTGTATENDNLWHDLQDLGQDLGKVSHSALKSLDGFRTFILRGNVVDLAIGIVIGGAFTLLVNSLVSDIITPLIPIPNTKGLATASISVFWTGGKLQYGAFINTIISFLIVAAVLYFFVVKPVNSLMKLYQPKVAEEKVTRDCPYCFQAVNVHATRCPFCTSHLIEDHEKHEAEGPALLLPESLEKLSEQLAEKIAKKTSSKPEQSSAESSEGSAATE